MRRFILRAGILASVLFCAARAFGQPNGATAADAAPAADPAPRALMQDALRRSLAEPAVAKSLKGYSVSPALTRLRRYQDPDARVPRVVCVVDLAIYDAGRCLLGSVRGRSTVMGEPPGKAIEAAVHAAVARLPEAVRAVEQSRNGQVRP